uniref:Ankyrin repeat domain 9 n=1 Tax=Myotis myotis TaxID=51298 RepID=A0A7J7RSD5_MYOMY|nr:hypothetical protein mMyoMyo1_000730 [Myotis myotis]
MRASEAFHGDERGLAAAYSPSEALLYALVHYLPATFPGFRCCAAPGPPVALAVRCTRVGALRRVLRPERDFPAEERAPAGPPGCGRAEGGGTALHVACELAPPECLFLLLGLRDGGGLTPLELLLRHLGHDSGATPATGAPAVPREAPAAPREARQRRLLLLDLLVLYTPAAARLARCELLGDRPRWQRLLGEDKFQWLAGWRRPRSSCAPCRCGSPPSRPAASPRPWMSCRPSCSRWTSRARASPGALGLDVGEHYFRRAIKFNILLEKPRWWHRLTPEIAASNNHFRDITKAQKGHHPEPREGWLSGNSTTRRKENIIPRLRGGAVLK